MNIIIVGDGEVGLHLAKMFTNERHNITVIDQNREMLEQVESNTDLLTIAGNATSIEILKQAKVQSADLLISVVHEERTNIVTSLLGKKLGAKKAIARVNNPEYLLDKNKALFRELGIDSVVSPEGIASREIINLLNQTAVSETFEFSHGKLSLFLIPLADDAIVIGKSLVDIDQEYGSLGFRAVAIHRKGKTIIPKGNDHFEINDQAYVISKPDSIKQVFELSGRETLPIKKIMIIGGGRIGRFTAKKLEEKISVKLIDKDPKRCESLSDILDNTLIINGDARDMQLLEEEGIQNIDAFIAVSNDSETNILTSLLAKRYGVKKIIALVENIEYIDIAQSIGIDTIINKKLITASYITRFTMDAEVANLKCLSGVDAEVLEFVVKEKTPITKKPIKKLHFPENAIIGGIIRGDDSLIATGDIQIQKDDRVVVFALPETIKKVNRFFH
ncbi:MAG: Trk system potassium transporter TrkA [Bacteroidota bacterium]